MEANPCHNVWSSNAIQFSILKHEHILQSNRLLAYPGVACHVIKGTHLWIKPNDCKQGEGRGSSKLFHLVNETDLQTNSKLKSAQLI